MRPWCVYQDFMSEILVLIRLCEFLFKTKLEQPENLQGGIIEGPFLTAWLHSPIYARQTAHSPDERSVSCGLTFNFLATPKK